MAMDHETVAAYLDRIGVSAPVAGDAAGLRTLHLAHQLAVPFENLSIHLAEPVSLAEGDLIAKIVHRRGGFCYPMSVGAPVFGLVVEAGGLQPGSGGLVLLFGVVVQDADRCAAGRSGEVRPGSSASNAGAGRGTPAAAGGTTRLGGC
jgi:arylamine N-acetyltransferase